MRTSGCPSASTVASAMAWGSLGSLACASANHSSNSEQGSIGAISESSNNLSVSVVATMVSGPAQRTGQARGASPYRMLPCLKAILPAPSEGTHARSLHRARGGQDGEREGTQVRLSQARQGSSPRPEQGRPQGTRQIRRDFVRLRLP